MKFSMLPGTMLERAGLLAAVTMFAGACATAPAPKTATVTGAPVMASAEEDQPYAVRSMFFKDRGLHPTL